MRVLLIEDEPTTAKAIELMLTTEGFNVYTTDLGEEGLDLGKLYDYDIICLDLNLPDMHGYDVLKKLRTAKVGTPVLILRGSARDSKFGRSASRRRLCHKTFHRDELVRAYTRCVPPFEGHRNVSRPGSCRHLDDEDVKCGSRSIDRKEYAMMDMTQPSQGTTLTRNCPQHLWRNGRARLKIIDV